MSSDEIRAGIRHFNAEDYFEAHEAWEDHWGIGNEREREATLGLIKVAVGFLHLKRGNRAGALKQLAWAVELLREHADAFPELRLREFVEEVDSVRAAVRFHDHDFAGIMERLEFPRLPLDSTASEATANRARAEEAGGARGSGERS